MIRSALSLLATPVVLLTACGGGAHPGGPVQAFDGRWYWENGDSSQSFVINLHAGGDSVTGSYCNIFGKAAADCTDSVVTVRGHITDSGMLVYFTTPGGYGRGTAILALQSGGLRWKVLRQPAVDARIPEAALLSHDRLGH